MSTAPASAGERARAAAARIEHGHALSRLGQWQDAVARYREALALAPREVEARLHLAEALAQLDEPGAAEVVLREALALAPDHGGARTALGTLLRRSGDSAAALEEFRRALYLAPQNPAGRYNVGRALADLDRIEEALVWLTQAAESGYLPAMTTLATAHLTLGAPAAALRWFRMALDSGDRSPLARLGEGLSRLTLGDMPAGWDGYEARPVATPFQVVSAARRWDGSQELRGRTLLVWAEQGLGDSIMFARYLPRLRARGARVVLAVQAPLATLMRDLADEVVGEGATLSFDLHCPLPSLPRAFSTSLATIPAEIPYLSADPARAADWAGHLGAGRNVGLVWAGSPEHGRDRERSLPFAAVAPLVGLPGLTWHVLQPQIAAGDRAALDEMARVHVPGPRFGDFSDTAACIAGLDLVVTADTSVAHLAGAMGKPCWVMLSQGADFRWLRDRDDTPWYPSVRLFRQTRRGDWAEVVARVVAALQGGGAISR